MKYLMVLSLFCITDVGVLEHVGESGPSLHQTLPSITSTGKSPTLKCFMQGSKVSNHVLSWYRQTKEDGIQFLVSHRDRSRPVYGEGVGERFISELEEATNAFTLTIGNAEKSDEGLYYCAVWYKSQYIFGEGTEIKVKETQNVRRPSVVFFQPSSLEIQYQQTATFLCHAKSYFPKPLRIKWLLNNQTQSPENVLFPAVQNADLSYDQTSSATIPVKLWRKGAEMTCVVEHESGVQITSIISSEESTFSSKECKPANVILEGVIPVLEEMTNQTQELTSEQYADYSEILSSAFIAYSTLLACGVIYGMVMFCCLIQRKLAKSKDKEKNQTSFSK
ncbi:immunoglobulin kappa light chain-like isoform X2 [Pyxicephalus adspersus]|uniref:immunoglobulin kappa light chain-like isoform X2 n=1 Tax=Pyxicephalus adspersus TaxID=30357 RepID=UPI003B5CA5C3